MVSIYVTNLYFSRKNEHGPAQEMWEVIKLAMRGFCHLVECWDLPMLWNVPWLLVGVLGVTNMRPGLRAWPSGVCGGFGCRNLSPLASCGLPSGAPQDLRSWPCSFRDSPGAFRCIQYWPGTGKH